MKVNSLRKLIREEVKAAIKEELTDILNEAVKIASKPDSGQANKLQPVKEKDLTRTWSKGPLNPAVGINSMLEQTAKEMTNEDYRNVVNADSSMVTAPAMSNTVASGLGMSGGNAPGLDISNLDFVKKAKSVLDLANQKSANKLS